MYKIGQIYELKVKSNDGLVWQTYDMKVTMVMKRDIHFDYKIIDDPTGMSQVGLEGNCWYSLSDINQWIADGSWTIREKMPVSLPKELFEI